MSNQAQHFTESVKTQMSANGEKTHERSEGDAMVRGLSFFPSRFDAFFTAVREYFRAGEDK